MAAEKPKTAIERLDPKTDGASANILKENIERLKELFPEIVTEGKIDFDALRELPAERNTADPAIPGRDPDAQPQAGRFKRNPQKYIEQVTAIIQDQMRQFIVDGIKYEKIGDDAFYVQELFQNEELHGYLSRNMLASQKSVYGHLAYDSDVERDLAERFERSTNVKVYAKLPHWFKIDTPLGPYNPDWAVLARARTPPDRVRARPDPLHRPQEPAERAGQHSARHGAGVDSRGNRPRFGRLHPPCGRAEPGRNGAGRTGGAHRTGGARGAGSGGARAMGTATRLPPRVDRRPRARRRAQRFRARAPANRPSSSRRNPVGRRLATRTGAISEYGSGSRSVIPRDHILEWRVQAPWPQTVQVEQDLIISRALVTIFSKPAPHDALAFRGGTALYKLHLPPARYSEDIHLVQTQAGPAKPMMDALHEVLNPWLGQPKTKQNEGRVTFVYRCSPKTRRRCRCGSRSRRIRANTSRRFIGTGVTAPAFSCLREIRTENEDLVGQTGIALPVSAGGIACRLPDVKSIIAAP